jgi:hypothetical protein
VTVKLPLVALRREDPGFARLRVFGDVRTDVRRDDHDPGDLRAFVSYLMASSRATWERDDIALAKLTVAVM